MIVVDASAVLAWAYADEAGHPDSTIDYVTANGARVPAHWILEVTNSLLVGERRGRLKAGQWPSLLVEIAALPIEEDKDTTKHGWDVIPALAEQFRLTTYDAAYLELALRLGVPLATLDQDLARAARKTGVRCLPNGRLRLSPAAALPARSRNSVCPAGPSAPARRDCGRRTRPAVSARS
jgi:predicted nucleic acid-binding protein